MTRRDSNIDPFNAGEPALPWDEPSQVIEEPGDAGGYTAPEEEPSSYEALRPRHEPRRRERAGRPHRTRSERPMPSHVGEEGEEPEEEMFPEDAALGDSSPTTKSSGGCGCFIAVLVLVLAIASVIAGDKAEIFVDTLIEKGPVAAFTGDTESVDETEREHDPNHSALRDLLTGDPDLEAEKEKEKVKGIMDSYLGDMANNEGVVNEVSTGFASRIENSLGYRVDELGIDMDAFLDWTFDNSGYEIGKVYVFDAYKDNPAEASGYFDVTARDSYGLSEKFIDQARAYLRSQAAEGLYSTSVDHAPLSDEQRAAISQIFGEALATTTEDSTFKLANLHYTFEDGSWKLDEEDAAREIAFALR